MQKKSLMRILLKDPDLIILEPTSALDKDSGATLLDSLKTIMGGKMVFIILHDGVFKEGADYLISI